ncbi:MAG: PaaI family thioesterase [Bacteroidota bacterium]
MERQYFQDYMEGNVCFGCGKDNPDGLQIKSYWDEDEAICIWSSQEKYHGWPKILNGGILATLIDCHCMGTAMAAAYRAENRGLDSYPFYRYATGTMNIRYLKPTSNLAPIELRTQIVEIKGRKVVMTCQAFSEGVQTATSDVIAIRVADESQAHGNNPFLQG